MTDKNRIDPDNITDFNRSEEELQLLWLFSIFVAGRHANFAVDVLAKFLHRRGELLPFDYIKGELEWSDDALHNLLVVNRVGQYTRIERAIKESLNLDLKTATLEELKSVYGVGNKTARMFLLHSRRDKRYAVLDVHILRWLREELSWTKAPYKTPSNDAEYEYWENVFLSMAQLHFPGIPLADVDLLLWKAMSGRASEE